MDQVIRFNKTFQERLTEFTDVLSAYEIVSARDIQKQWSFYLEMTIDTIGWQAIWKIPRSKCEQFNIAFPTIVLVYVENIKFESLEAIVKILAVQHDIHLPEKHCVPLIQLWPTKQQDKTIALNLTATANGLDMLRFFYLYVFLPWDVEEDDLGDWVNKHLLNRLRLYYDANNGTLPTRAAEYVMSLINEAHRLQARQEQIAFCVEDDDDELNNDKDQECMQKLADIKIQMIQICSEFEILENSILRERFLKKQVVSQSKKLDNKPQSLLVFNTGKIDDHITFLQQVKNYITDENVTFFSTLELALENANKNDIIILNSSSHVFETLNNIKNGGTLMGIHSKEDTIINTTNDNIMLDCNGNITLRNLTIQVTSQCGILVRSGNVTMNNCKIIGNGKSSTQQGIIVLNGRKLEMIGCEITQFYTGIVGNSGSKIILQNCEVHDMNIGVKMYDKCQAKLESSCFHHCKDYGICVETGSNNNKHVYRAGSFDILKVIPDVITEDITGENNGKEDVLINTKTNLEPILDLFSNSCLNPTPHADGSTDDEMEINPFDESITNHNNTVVENS